MEENLINNVKWSAAALAVLLVGCATTAPAPVVAPPQTDRRADALLSDALARRAEVTAQTPATQSANAATSVAFQTLPSSGRVSLDYAGDARSLLRQLGAARSIQFQIEGPQPHLPLFVIVNVKDAAFEDVLRSIGMQFGQRADLRYVPAQRISIVYGNERSAHSVVAPLHISDKSVPTTANALASPASIAPGAAGASEAPTTTPDRVASEKAQPLVWELRTGSAGGSGNMQHELARWAKDANYQFSWGVRAEIEFDMNRTYRGTFEEAIKQLKKDLVDSSYPIEPLLYEGNRVLRVVHVGGRK